MIFECPYYKLCHYAEELKCTELFYRNYCAETDKGERRRVPIEMIEVTKINIPKGIRVGKAKGLEDKPLGIGSLL